MYIVVEVGYRLVLYVFGGHSLGGSMNVLRGLNTG
jgi:hypothetical protein